MRKLNTEPLQLTTKYINEPADLFLDRYVFDDYLALYAADPLTGERLIMISTNLDTSPSPGCIWVKEWSENQGVENWLIANNISTPTGRSAPAGHTTANEHRILNLPEESLS